MLKKLHLLSLIVPVYNEEESLKFFLKKINSIFTNSIPFQLEIIFINDGSTDSSLELLVNLQKIDKRITIIDLSRNFGKESALTAGLEQAKGDAIVPIDVDLQDPPELIMKMLEKWNLGFDVVVAKRIDRSSDSWMKRNTSAFFYSLYNKISDVKIPENVGDFRLMDRSVVDAIKKLTETNRFMKGVFNWVGFRTTYVEYSRAKRISGESKFTFLKLSNFAIDAFTSFSTAPLRISIYFGFVASFVSFLLGANIIIETIFFGIKIPGYASLATIVLFIGGIQLIAIGVIGEYIGKIYLESKRRPIFIVRKVYK